MSQAGSYKINMTPPIPGLVSTLTGDSGGPVSPDGAGNINIVGGTGVTVVDNPGTHTLTINTSADLTLTGDSGGAVSPDGSGNINIVGSSGIVVSDNPGTHTLTISTTGGSGFTWSVITADQSAVAGNGYICNKGSTLVLTLPATSAIGDLIEVTGINNATGWSIAQNAGQIIHFGAADTTTGVAGSLASTLTRDSVKIVCMVAGASAEWNVLSSIGNLNVT